MAKLICQAANILARLFMPKIQSIFWTGMLNKIIFLRTSYEVRSFSTASTVPRNLPLTSRLALRNGSLLPFSSPRASTEPFSTSAYTATTATIAVPFTSMIFSLSVTASSLVYLQLISRLQTQPGSQRLQHRPIMPTPLLPSTRQRTSLATL